MALCSDRSCKAKSCQCCDILSEALTEEWESSSCSHLVDTVAILPSHNFTNILVHNLPASNVLTLQLLTPALRRCRWRNRSDRILNCSPWAVSVWQKWGSRWSSFIYNQHPDRTCCTGLGIRAADRPLANVVSTYVVIKVDGTKSSAAHCSREFAGHYFCIDILVNYHWFQYFSQKLAESAILFYNIACSIWMKNEFDWCDIHWMSRIAETQHFSGINVLQSPNQETLCSPAILDIRRMLVHHVTIIKLVLHRNWECNVVERYWFCHLVELILSSCQCV